MTIHAPPRYCRSACEDRLIGNASATVVLLTLTVACIFCVRDPLFVEAIGGDPTVAAHRALYLTGMAVFFGILALLTTGQAVIWWLRAMEADDGA